MRSVIICLISLLLVPTLVASKRFSPPPPLNEVPEHGDFVRYQASNGPHVGIVVGSQARPFGNINIAPLVPHSAHPPDSPIIAAHDHLVTASPGQVANTGHSSPHLATQIEDHHEDNPPTVSHVSGAVHGSPIHQAMRGLHGSRYR